MELSMRWARRGLARWHQTGDGSQALFGIVQGGIYPDLRRRSVETLQEMGFPGIAVGGLSVGEPKDAMFETVGHTAPLLPWDKPRYLMGVGTPKDLVRAVAQRHRHVRLCPADAKRAERLSFHEPGTSVDKKRALRGRRSSGRPRLFLSCLSQVFPGLSASPVHVRRASCRHSEHVSQPRLLS